MMAPRTRSAAGRREAAPAMSAVLRRMGIWLQLYSRGLPGSPTAVDDEVVPGDVGGSVGGQVDDCTFEIGGIAHSAEGSLGFVVANEDVVVVRASAEVRVVESAGSYGVDADVVRREVSGEVAGELDDSRLH